MSRTIRCPSCDSFLDEDEDDDTFCPCCGWSQSEEEMKIADSHVKIGL